MPIRNLADSQSTIGRAAGLLHWLSADLCILGFDTGEIGQNSRMVICGDPRQVDIPGGDRMSGLADAVDKLEHTEGFGTIRFTAADVVRHPIVGRIVEAYEGE